VYLVSQFVFCGVL